MQNKVKFACNGQTNRKYDTFHLKDFLYMLPIDGDLEAAPPGLVHKVRVVDFTGMA